VLAEIPVFGPQLALGNADLLITGIAPDSVIRSGIKTTKGETHVT
jgi:hypothetical protein